jgi:2-polyprenyl-3-methyl-5-hydroxy-6-metoxy-1,4-benzoquinol methylase
MIMGEYFDKKAKAWDQQKDRIERAHVIAKLMKARIPITTAMNALEFGCGTGLLGFELINNVGNLTFTDTSAGMLEEVKRKVKDLKIITYRIIDLSEEELIGQFDLIFSLMALHHIEDYEFEVRKLIQKLTVGGFICLCDLDREDGSFHTEIKVPHNGFDRSQIESIYKTCGLEPVCSITAYVDRRQIGSEEREYPIFMIIGKRIA